MDYKSICDWYTSMAAVFSFDQMPDGTFSEIRIEAMNKAYENHFTSLGLDVPEFYPGIPYRSYFYDINFERTLINAALKDDITYSYVGYSTQTVSITALKDTTINVKLIPGTSLDEAVVTAQRESGIASTKMSAIEVPVAVIKSAPALFGEADVLKTIQLLPGVQGGTEVFSGLYVRGGGPDENLLLLDGIPIYNA